MTKFDEYAVLTAQIEALENQRATVRKDILEEMIAKGETKIEHTLGTFSRVITKKWTYPEYVLEAKKEVEEVEAVYKGIKAKSENPGGGATYEEVPQLRFTEIKL